jgi:hypothetical protein
MSSYRRTIPAADMPFNQPGAAADRRAQALERDRQLLEARRRRLDEQTSPSNSPEARIQIWERTHALHLPRASEHNLVYIVAEQTDLTVAQVREEQERRAAAAAAANPA